MGSDETHTRAHAGRPVVELEVPARFRIEVEGPLEHQVAFLSALRDLAGELGALVVARPKKPEMTPDEAEDDDLGDLRSW